MRLPKRNKIDRNKKIKFNFEKKYKQREDGIKPNGFWYSCYNDWYNSTQLEGMFQYKYIHKIEIKNNVLINIKKKDKDKILVINNEKDFNIFNKKYGYKSSYNKKFWEEKGGGNYLIKWENVANDYGGIEICPYLKKKRYYLWYSTFDVASGCIWNIKSIIKGSKLIYQYKKGEYVKVNL